MGSKRQTSERDSRDPYYRTPLNPDVPPAELRD